MDRPALVENNLDLRDARCALVLVERLPSCSDAPRRLTHRR